MAYFLSRKSSQIGKDQVSRVDFRAGLNVTPPGRAGSSSRVDFLALGVDSRLYKSNLHAWNAVATPSPTITSFAMRKDGVVFALASSRLCLFERDSCRVSSVVGQVTWRGKEVSMIRGLTFSEQPDELWGIALNGSLPGIHTDSLIRIDTSNGEVDGVSPLGRCDVMSLAAPPTAGGPWHGIAMFMWTHRGGLYGMKWANEGHRMVPRWRAA
jgi:hypothetical protein